MAESVVRLRVDSQEYNDKLKNASTELNRFVEQTRRSGESMANASKGATEFVRAMGSMGTKAGNTKGQLREITTALTDLTAQYRALTDEEKSSDFGKAMAASIDQLTERAGNAKDAMADVAASIQNAASDTRAFDQISAGVGLVTASFQTLQGGAQMLGFELGSNVEVIARLQAAMAVTNGLTQIQNTLQKQSALMQGVMKTQLLARAAAEALATKGTKAATVAQAAFNAVAKANPYVLLASVAVAAGAALLAFAGKADDATEAEKRNQEQTEAMKRMHEDAANSMQQSIGSAAADVTAKFAMLQTEWNNLKTVGEQKQWIDNNQAAFNALGLSVRNVNAAYQVFVKQASQVVAALQAIAKAKAMEEVYKENLKKYYNEQFFTGEGGRTHENGGKYYTVSSGQTINREEARLAGLDMTIGPDSNPDIRWGGGGAGGHYYYTEEGARKVNKYRNNQAWQIHTNRLSEMEKVNKRMYDEWQRLQAESIEKQKGLPWFTGGGLGGYTKGGFNIGAGGGGGHHSGGGSGSGGGSNTQPKTDVEKWNADIKKLEEEYKTATAERKTEIQGEIKALQDRIDKAKELVDEAHGKAIPKNSISYWEQEISKAKEMMDLATNENDYAYWEGYAEQAEKFIKKIKGEVEEPVEMEIAPKGMSQASIDGWIQQLQESLAGKEIGTEAWKNTFANLIDAQTFANTISLAAQQGVDLAAAGIDTEAIWDAILNEENIPDSTWENLATVINEKLKELGIDSITIDVKTGDVTQAAKDTAQGWNEAANAVKSVGSAIGQLEDPSAKVAGIVAQAIAEIALGFAQATTAAAAGGPWAWIAAIAASIGTMISTMNAIHSATGYAEGGIVKGNTYSGDQIRANGGSIGLNAGELILNRAQQGNIASALRGSDAGGNRQPYLDVETIWLGIGHFLKRKGMGEIVTSKSK